MNQKSNILIINQNSGYLTVDILNAYAKKYDKVVLIAGRISTVERQLNKNVRIQKIIKYNRENPFNRIFTWCIGSLQIFFLLLLRYQQYEVIYFTNPPMAYLSSLLLKNSFSIIVYDTYPDALKNIGINEKSIIYRLWSVSNKTLFKRADKIIALSNGMAERLSVYVEKGKIRVIPNWSGSDKFAPLIKEDNLFVTNNHMVGKFIVLYSGNMGITHNVETLIEVAKKLESKDKIHFLFIGEGDKKEKLQKKSHEYNLSNCTFLTWQHSSVLHYSLASADLAVITINKESAQLSVPSKTYNLLAVGSPLLCIAPENSELAALVHKYNNGNCFDNTDLDGIAQFILTIAENEDLKMLYSRNSLNAAKDFHFSNALKYI